MFEKSLVDLVKGLRACRKNEAQYISQCIGEIKEELKSRETWKKNRAILKLTYLQMLGYDMSWASFYVVEAMSDSKFSHKRIGYLAASQSFRDDTNVLLLTIQLFKKDLSSQVPYEVGLATNCLSNIVTPDLGRDLVADVVALLKSNKPYVRKKAILLLYKIFLRFPEALRPSFDRLKEKLEDSDPSVVSAAVNVFCELSRKNPKNYLALAPLFFKLLTSSNNNWMLIKIVKLMGCLLPHEPRLAKKLVDPLTNIITTTPAKSLLYECVNTVTVAMAAGMTATPSLAKLCMEKLRLFVEDPDQNLKYLGLLGLLNLMKTHPHAVAEHKDLIMSCMRDEDITIRTRALDLVTAMIDKDTIVDIVGLLMQRSKGADGPFLELLVEKLLATCSADSYDRITNFQWYLGTLADVARIAPAKHVPTVAAQIIDVAVRVKAVRPFASNLMTSLISNPSQLADTPRDSSAHQQVLQAAAWVVGEYPSHLEDPATTVDALLRPSTLSLPPNVQSLYLQAALKIYASLVAQGSASAGAVAASLSEKVNDFVYSTDIEVQERAFFLKEMLRLLPGLPDSGQDLASLFRDELNPVAPKAQKKVPVPEGLDLDTPFFEAEPEAQIEEPVTVDKEYDQLFQSQSEPPSRPAPLDKEAADRDRAARRERRAHDPYYLAASGSSQDGQVPPLVPLGADFTIPLSVATGSRPTRTSSAAQEAVEIFKGVDLPPGVSLSDHDDEGREDDLSRVDLTAPGGSGVLPTIAPYGSSQSSSAALKLSKQDSRRTSSRSQQGPAPSPKPLIDFGDAPSAGAALPEPPENPNGLEPGYVDFGSTAPASQGFSSQPEAKERHKHKHKHRHRHRDQKQ